MTLIRRKPPAPPQTNEPNDRRAIAMLNEARTTEDFRFALSLDPGASTSARPESLTAGS